MVILRIIYVVIASYKSQTSQSVGQGPRLNSQKNVVSQYADCPNISKTVRSLCDVLESFGILNYVKTDNKTINCSTGCSGVFLQAVYVRN